MHYLRSVLETGRCHIQLLALCQVYRWLGQKWHFLCIHGKQNIKRTTNYIIFMSVSVIFHCVHTENDIFAPTTGRLETPITALYCISGEKLLKYCINMVLYSC